MIWLSDNVNEDDTEAMFGGLAIRHHILGDYNWSGLWYNDQSIWVWGDRKHLGDLVQCVLDTGRLLRQLQAAYQAGFSHFFVVIEAIFRPSPSSGLLEVRRGQAWTPYHIQVQNQDSPTIEYKRIDQYLNELSLYAGVQVKRSSNPAETVRQVVDLYHLYQQPPESHHSLPQFYRPSDQQHQYLIKPSLVRRIAKELPHIGWERSKAVEARFKSVEEMIQAGVKEWQEVDGIGPKISQEVVDAPGWKRDLAQ